MTRKQLPFERARDRAIREGVHVVGRSLDGKYLRVMGSRGTIYEIDLATLTCHCQVHCHDQTLPIEERKVFCSHQWIAREEVRRLAKARKAADDAAQARDSVRDGALMQRFDNRAPSIFR